MFSMCGVIEFSSDPFLTLVVSLSIAVEVIRRVKLYHLGVELTGQPLVKFSKVCILVPVKASSQFLGCEIVVSCRLM